jgi:hypothetical protein
VQFAVPFDRKIAPGAFDAGRLLCRLEKTGAPNVITLVSSDNIRFRSQIGRVATESNRLFFFRPSMHTEIGKPVCLPVEPGHLVSFPNS